MAASCEDYVYDEHLKSKSQKSVTIGTAAVVLITIASISYAALTSGGLQSRSVPKISFANKEPAVEEKASSSKPHIVFILADDLGWNSIGYEDYDLSFTTPTLTTMAQSGIILTNYYAQEVCTPSRAALLTGRYPLSTGMQYGVVETDTAWGLNLNETTLAEALHNNGYSTHMIGKWHLGHQSPRYLPTARGFDTFTGYLDGDNYYFSKRNPTLNLFHDFISADQECYYTYDNSDMHNYSTHFYRDLAIKTIEDHDQSVPLFLYLAFQAG